MQPHKANGVRRYIAQVAAGVLATTSALAQDFISVRLPEAPQTAQAARDTFDARAQAIIQLQACGQEIKYVTYRRTLAAKNYEDGQGEGLSSLLIAKIAWLTDPRFSHLPCEYKVALTTAERNKLEPWSTDLSPWNCSRPTSLTNETGASLTVFFRVTPECLRRQVNEAILAMHKFHQMGTTGIPCIESLDILGTGEFDVTVRDVVRILYMGSGGRSPVLDAGTLAHMWRQLLAARGPLGDAEYSVVAGCADPAGDDFGTPEDYADRQRWYNKVLSSLDDPFNWLEDFLAKLGGGILHSAAAVVGAPVFLALGKDPLPSILPHFDVLVPETENHRLMIESSRYLTNIQLVIALKGLGYEDTSLLEAQNADVERWLIARLAQIALRDFDEYNARPYTRYSLMAAMNLADFAPDPVRKLAQIVLDRSAAKFAAGSNHGRRNPPFRRRTEYDSKPLNTLIEGADYEVLRQLILTGQTQLLGHDVNGDVASPMVNTAVSGYRPPKAVLEAVVERTGVFAQDVRHAAVERYYATPAFTMTVGGFGIPPALDFYGIRGDSDYGVAMPTSLIPTRGGIELKDIYRFQGIGEGRERSPNLCGWRGFICGIAPAVSEKFGCQANTDQISVPDASYTLVNSTKCEPAASGPHFYLAAREFPCTAQLCGEGNAGLKFGIMEMVDAPDPSDHDFVANFKIARIAALQSAAPDAAGIGTYKTQQGETIRYRLAEGIAEIVDVDGVARPIVSTSGALINVSGTTMRISSPVSSARVDIDLTDPKSPVRSELP